MRFRLPVAILSFLFLFSSFSFSSKEIDWLGKKIWQNECAGTIEGLTSWNEGEEFASLGIGHFIWYPKGKSGPFKESFPDLLLFLEEKGAKVPYWLRKEKGCPWKSRDKFLQAKKSRKMNSLRKLLVSTVPLQALFMARRLENALPHITAGLDEPERIRVTRNFSLVAKTPMGVYALLDYLNFKGEGAGSAEKYNGVGWGLLQALQEMPTQSNRRPIEEFVDGAKKILARRVENAPPERNEARWLKGWYNRLDTYLREN